MNNEKVAKIGYKSLIEVGNENGSAYYAVIVSHNELDYLVGRLMQMCDLTGDIEQRQALKSTIKQISRDWLDGLYEDSGYDKWSGVIDGIKPIKI